MRVRAAVQAFLSVTPALVAAACATSGSSSGPIGPVYGLDGGADVTTDNLPDAGARRDATTTPPPHHDGGTLSFDTGSGVSDAGASADVVTVKVDGGGDATLSDAAHPLDAHADASGDAPSVADAQKDAADAKTADAREDASDASGASADAGGCTAGSGTVAIVGGTSALAFGAVSKAGGAWAVTSFTGKSVLAPPAVELLGTGFLALFPSTINDIIESTLYSSSGTPGWSIPSPMAALTGVDAAATELGAPALGVTGTTAQLVYRGSNSKYYHGTYSGAAWGAASDPVGGTTSQDFGPSPASVAVVGSTLYAAYDGNDGNLYVESWTSSGGWAGAKQVAGASIANGTPVVGPTLVALTGAGPDLMVVYPTKTSYVFYYSVHAAGAAGGTWSTPALVRDTTVYGSNPVALAPLASGGVVLLYEGGNGLAYGSIYAPTATPAWTTPVQVGTGTSSLHSPPSVAAGPCGSQAVAALVDDSGVSIATLKSGAWGTAAYISGISSATYATVVTGP